jgi:hypothetical protein
VVKTKRPPGLKARGASQGGHGILEVLPDVPGDHDVEGSSFGHELSRVPLKTDRRGPGRPAAQREGLIPSVPAGPLRLVQEQPHGGADLQQLSWMARGAPGSSVLIRARPGTAPPLDLEAKYSGSLRRGTGLQSARRRWEASSARARSRGKRRYRRGRRDTETCRRASPWRWGVPRTFDG